MSADLDCVACIERQSELRQQFRLVEGRAARGWRSGMQRIERLKAETKACRESGHAAVARAADAACVARYGHHRDAS